MTRVVFQKELQELREHVSLMGNQVEKQYELLFTSIEKRDTHTIVNIMKNDRSVNDMERSIEAQCLHLITKQQPVAGDLRTISACLKVVTDIERMGDHVADIAELILRLDLEEVAVASDHLTQMIKETGKIMKDAIAVFNGREQEKVKEVMAYDDVIDGLFHEVKEDIITALKENKCSHDTCVDVLMIAKYLERIGDHAVNITEWENFQESGTIDQIRIL